jgi:hypothetical protein
MLRHKPAMPEWDLEPDIEARRFNVVEVPEADQEAFGQFY